VFARCARVKVTYWAFLAIRLEATDCAAIVHLNGVVGGIIAAEDAVLNAVLLFRQDETDVRYFGAYL